MCNYSPRTGTCPKHGIITLLSQTCCCSDWGLGIVQGWHQITHWGNQGRINTSNEALIYIISYFLVSFLSWVLPAYITFHLLLWYYSLFLFLFFFFWKYHYFLWFYQSHVLKYSFIIPCVIHTVSIWETFVINKCLSYFLYDYSFWNRISFLVLLISVKYFRWWGAGMK